MATRQPFPAETFEELPTPEEAVARALAALIPPLMARMGLESSRHLERVAKLAVRVGERIGFPDLRGLALGAVLHDAGKLLLPPTLLDKPGPLSDDEWKTVRDHPKAGHALFVQVPHVPQTALNVILYHHERLDGSGYPFGLRGSAIPQEARIFAVVDVWDALVHARPYKPAWPEAKARDALLAQAGSQLDAHAVQALLAVLEE